MATRLRQQKMVMSACPPARARVVIETIGSQSAMLEDAMPSMNSTRALSQWLENSITLNRKDFNPEEGEWVNLDVAAISRMGLRNWVFTIVPSDTKNAKPIFSIDGKGNLLKRLSWDGHDQKSGDFVRAGNYLAKLVAINGDGTIKTQEETFCKWSVLLLIRQFSLRNQRRKIKNKPRSPKLSLLPPGEKAQSPTRRGMRQRLTQRPPRRLRHGSRWGRGKNCS